ncbi:hypothetical protein EJ04DRAFT_603426 [Polyplosphaeria fusca]|uniref:Uncharacterized protein n=1 Tax=Polyplosphaeria fusca TaxID=682080 RepID=A0A9P4R041_9PLEO|nr:hypothetical protein EJ04DRAFT_603426 [Polyplosphaeria fusca]
MDIDKRVPYRLGTAKLAPLPNEWDIVGGRFPPKVQEAGAIAVECLQGGSTAMLYIRRCGEERNTVLFLSSYAPALKDKWQNAIEKLYECFQHEDGLIAEIVDYQVHNPLYPESITTAEVDLYQLAALFDDHEWMTVDVLRWYSPVRQENWPTVVITARDAGKDSWWSEKIPAVEQFLKDQGLDLEVVLQFLDQMFTHPKEYYELSRGLRNSRVYSGPDIGSSLGIQNVAGSATLGCRVLVEDGRQFGMTTCRNFQQGPGSTQTGLIGLKMLTPSLDDERVAKKYDPEYTMDRSPYECGKIFAVSSGSSLTDWCLIELDRHELIFKDPKIWARVKDGKTYQVKKTGRSTGLKEGTISASSSLINFKCIEPAQDAGTITSARCIVSKDPLEFFGFPGDAGASVQENDSGAILGLCLAYNSATKVMYMTPMATIFGEISDAIASKIKEPKEIQLE